MKTFLSEFFLFSNGGIRDLLVLEASLKSLHYFHSPFSFSNPHKRIEEAENSTASSNNSASLSQPSILLFDGEGYERRSIMMKTPFWSHVLEKVKANSKILEICFISCL